MTKKSNPLDVFFHMSNHYRKLRNVKSIIDTNLGPKGYEYGTTKADKFNTRTSRDGMDSPSRVDKKGSSVQVKGSAWFENSPRKSVRSKSSPRPPTRRNIQMPSKVNDT